MSKKTAYMSRADVIVLMTAHCASNMLDTHGGAEDTPARVVAFATKLADELVAQGVVDAPALWSDEDKGGRYEPSQYDRTSTDDEAELEFDEEDGEDDFPASSHNAGPGLEAIPSVPATEPAPAPTAPIEQPMSAAEALAQPHEGG